MMGTAAGWGYLAKWADCIFFHTIIAGLCMSDATMNGLYSLKNM